MSLDNPSYFSMSHDEPDFIRHKLQPSSSQSSSECSLSRQLTPPRCSNNRRELRNFLRSVSTNSADSNQELLIMGEPRLSDMDPDLAFKHPASGHNSLKRPQMYSEKHPDLLYLPLPTHEDSEDEVFVSETSARYYNFNAIRQMKNGENGSTNSVPGTSASERRHSISTFASRDRTSSIASSSKSYKDDFSDVVKDSDKAPTYPIDEHSLRHKSFPRKRCLQCSKGTLNRLSPNMDDILIVSLKSSEAASLWVEYFANYFNQISKQANRKPFKIQNLDIGEPLSELLEQKDFHEKATKVKLQLVVVCPSFLEYVAQHPDESRHLGQILLSDRTLALLLGVTDSDLTDVHKNALPSYFQWQRQSVGQDQDENFTKEFLGQAMVIFSKIWKQQSSVVAQEKPCFSVTPKKIRQGQNSVFILLTYPLQKEDIVKISIERNGEILELKSAKRRNPYLVKINVPENLTEITSIVNILVEKNGSIIGSRPIKCESKLRELEQILRSTNNPVEFMCQTLGFSPADREQLDTWLVHGFQKNLPPHFNLLANNPTPFHATIQMHKHSNEEYPTLLHFAAKFGLEKLAMHLLDCPGADVAYEVRNVFDLTPTEMAENNGFSQLANLLRGYMNMNEVSNMYTKLKELSNNKGNKPTDEDDGGYLVPNNVHEFLNNYKVCPAPRPVLSPQISIEKSPLTPSSEYGSSTYMAMSPTVSTTSSFQSREDLNLVKKPEQLKVTKKEQHNHHKSKTSLNSKKNGVEIEDKVQKELAEIIMDFKNNVHSLPQVEKLVEDWKNRNDVQMSFMEKKKQLDMMRERYEKIQQEIKASTKKPTPFEKLKRLFSKQKSHSTEDKSTIDETSSIQHISGPAMAMNQSSRPISSLSTSSSGSSGRMSTISGCSLGDSGTHSDNEERKLILSHSQTSDDFKADLDRAIMQLNYTPVPVPKPVKFPQMHHFETIEEKPSSPAKRPDTLALNNDNFYIQFPPNGLPVPGLIAQSESKSLPESPNRQADYMNIQVDVDVHHEYMNFKSPNLA